jgi:hypothetical protein
MLSILFNTSINRKYINDNSRVKRTTRALFIVKKKRKRNDDDVNDIFNVIDNFNAANENDENDNDEFKKNKRDINETS